MGGVYPGRGCHPAPANPVYKLDAAARPVQGRPRTARGALAQRARAGSDAAACACTLWLPYPTLPYAGARLEDGDVLAASVVGQDHVQDVAPLRRALLPARVAVPGAALRARACRASDPVPTLPAPRARARRSAGAGRPGSAAIRAGRQALHGDPGL
jgi:hypothetical protein